MVMPLNQAVFRRFAGGAVRRGWSANRILSRAKALGFGVRRTYGLESIRQFAGLVRGESLFKAAPAGKPLSSFAMVPGDFRPDRRYYITGKQTRLNTLTGKTEQTWVSLYDNENRGPDGWGDVFTGRFDWRYQEEGFEIVDTEMSSCQLNKNWSPT